LEKQARKLQEQLDKSTKARAQSPRTDRPGRRHAARAGTDRARHERAAVKPGDRAKKTPAEPVKEPAPPDEGMVIPAKEVAAATTADILGKPPNQSGTPRARGKSGRATPRSVPPSRTAERPNLAATAPAPAQTQTRPAQTQTDRRGRHAQNRQLPVAAAGFPAIPRHHPKPTESKEELMANARLMQQTLAQFDIEVALGDITKGPTITRYELHPAPGVKLEKIVA
jgi:DNA segregation ATPase FtsK/SpoIIIE, S-DNA-T family